MYVRRTRTVWHFVRSMITRAQRCIAVIELSRPDLMTTDKLEEWQHLNNNFKKAIKYLNKIDLRLKHRVYSILDAS